jgi:ATP-dependent protease ClpP protease subunit
MKQQTFRLQDDAETDKRELYLPFSERVVQQVRIIVPIDQQINEPSYYRSVVERMDQLSEGDEIVFRINSEGGRLDGLLSLLDAIDTTEATTIAHIQGECHSAASILALNCDNVYVSPYASMLVHFVSFGYAGKGMDVAHMVSHTLEQSNRLIVPTYKGFCTDEEIDEIIKGKQLWLGAEEIQRRLQLKLEYLSKETEVPEEIVKPEKKTK